MPVLLAMPTPEVSPAARRQANRRSSRQHLPRQMSYARQHRGSPLWRPWCPSNLCRPTRSRQQRSSHQRRRCRGPVPCAQMPGQWAGLHTARPPDTHPLPAPHRSPSPHRPPLRPRPAHTPLPQPPCPPPRMCAMKCDRRPVRPRRMTLRQAHRARHPRRHPRSPPPPGRHCCAAACAIQASRSPRGSP